MDYVIKKERLTPVEYIAFLRRCDLGSQYPAERFETRIKTLLDKASISLSARDNNGELIGICLGITDFAYWLFITDLGVARDFTGRGIGRALVSQTHKEAGGADDITMYVCANDNAVAFYEKLGMKHSDDVMVLGCTEWTDFTV